jgi:hypothetical protein
MTIDLHRKVPSLLFTILSGYKSHPFNLISSVLVYRRPIVQSLGGGGGVNWREVDTVGRLQGVRQSWGRPGVGKRRGGTAGGGRWRGATKKLWMVGMSRTAGIAIPMQTDIILSTDTTTEVHNVQYAV